jgi:hypothetical protein
LLTPIIEIYNHENIAKTFPTLGLISLLGFGGMSQSAFAPQTLTTTSAAKTNLVLTKAKSVAYNKKRTQ